MNGLLVDFFDHGALTEALIAACRRPDDFLPLQAGGEGDRDHRVQQIDCTTAWVDLLEGLCVPAH